MDAATTYRRLLHAEARIAQLEDWRGVVLERARSAMRAGLNVFLFLAFLGVLHLAASFDER